MTDKFAEVTTKREVVYKGAIIDVVVDDVLLPNGETSKRELVFHNGAVGIIPITKEGKIVLVKQFRKALEKSILEIPAGKIEKNEIIEYLDFPDDLWGIGNSVGYQDESKGCVQQILSSLYLIQVSNLKLYTNNFNEKIRPRASFSYNSINYDLAVTCLAFNDYMRTSSNYDSAILCISLGEPYSVDNRCYKLVASIYI